MLSLTRGVAPGSSIALLAGHRCRCRPCFRVSFICLHLGKVISTSYNNSNIYKRRTHSALSMTARTWRKRKPHIAAYSPRWAGSGLKSKFPGLAASCATPLPAAAPLQTQPCSETGTLFEQMQGKAGCAALQHPYVSALPRCPCKKAYAAGWQRQGLEARQSAVACSSATSGGLQSGEAERRHVCTRSINMGHGKSLRLMHCAPAAENKRS